MPGLTIRQYGDPVLKERARDVEDIDGAVASLVDAMIETMYDAPGTGLAAKPVPGAAYIVSIIESTRLAREPSMSSTSRARSFSTGSPY